MNDAIGRTPIGIGSDPGLNAPVRQREPRLVRQRNVIIGAPAEVQRQVSAWLERVRRICAVQGCPTLLCTVRDAVVVRIRQTRICAQSLLVAIDQAVTVEVLKTVRSAVVVGVRLERIPIRPVLVEVVQPVTVLVRCRIAVTIEEHLLPPIGKTITIHVNDTEDVRIDT